MLFIFISTLLTASPIKWEGWRGLGKQGVSESKDIVTEWSPGNNILWKVDLPGEGYSSPVISGNKVFVSSAEYTSYGLSWKSLPVFFLFVLLVIVILTSLIKILRNQNGIASFGILVKSLLVCTVLGLVLFAFSLMGWIYFNINRDASNSLIANWLFMGSLVLFVFYLLILTSNLNQFARFLLSLTSLPFIYFLIANRPYPEFHSIKMLFTNEALAIFLLVIQAIYLPLIAILMFLLFSFIPKQNIKRLDSIINFRKEHKIILNLLLFIIGGTGFFIIPFFTVMKVYFRRIYTGGFSSVSSISEMLEFAYPYFYTVILIGFVILFYLQFQRFKLSSVGWRWTFPAIFILTVILFLVVNFSRNEITVKRYITCYDRLSGEMNWKKGALSGIPIEVSRDNSQATPTPVIMGDKIYAYFGDAGMMCTDFYGSLIWINKDLPYSCINGVAASPVKSSNAIILCNATTDSPYITALDPATGVPIWKNSLLNSIGTLGEYRTPTILKINGLEYLMEWNSINNELRFFSAQTGQLFAKYQPNWKRGGENIVSPIITSDTLFLGDRIGVHAVSIQRIIDGLDPVLWSVFLKGKGPNTSSPIKVGNNIYTISDNGFMNCLDSRKGTVKWKKKVPGTFYSSLFSLNNLVFATNTSGTTTVFINQDEFEVVAKNELNEQVRASIATVEGQLFFRTDKSLWCIGI